MSCLKGPNLAPVLLGLAADDVVRMPLGLVQPAQRGARTLGDLLPLLRQPGTLAWACTRGLSLPSRWIHRQGLGQLQQRLASCGLHEETHELPCPCLREGAHLAPCAPP